jgi:hypothetical protein
MTHKLLKRTPDKWHACFASILALAGTTLVHAQEAPMVSEDVYELSPFVVQSEEGWIATETLAGSRLRTDFKDVAAQIEVLTMDFMDDFALTSVNEAAIYSMNLENSYDAVTGNGYGGGNDGLRIRGLATPTNSKEFFGSMIRSDNYNLDRITVSSGPSSILFGTGSPAGVVDASLKRAFFNDLNKLSLRIDSLGSKRVMLDVNKVLVDDKVAVRVIGLHNDERFAEKYGYDDQRRGYVALNLKPFENTSIHVMYEDFYRQSSRPSRVYPFDGGSVALWNELGRPLFDNNLAWQQSGRPRAGFQAQMSDVQINYGRTSPTFILNGSDTEGVHTWWGSLEFGGPQNRPSVNTINREADGWTFLNDDYVPIDIHTATNSSTEDGKAINLNLQQRLLENLYLDVAYQKEEINEFSSNPLDYISGLSISVDPNKFLPNGVTPNPNAGRLYIDGFNDYAKGEQFGEDVRAAISYEFDFADKLQNNKILKWFGKHRLAGLASSNKTEQRRQSYHYYITPEMTANGAIWPNFPNADWKNPYQLNPDGTARKDASGNLIRTAGNVDFVASNTNRVRTRVYVDDTVGWRSFANFNVGEPMTIVDHSGKAWTIDPENTGFFNDRGERLVMQGFSPSGRQKQDTVQFSYMGYFWENRIIATYGWRKDTIASANLLNAGQQDRWTGMRNHLWDLEWGEWGGTQSGTTETRGLVIAPLRGIVNIPYVSDIRFSYNESDTFQANTNNYSPFGRQYPGALGDGEDMKVVLELFDGKLSISWNEYENTNGPSRAGNVPFNRHRFTLNGPVNRVKAIWGDFDLAEVAGVDNEWIYNQKGGGDPYWVVSFKKAKGREIGVNWKVTDQLDIRFNYTEMDVTESDIGLEWWEWEDRFIEVVSRMSIPEGGTFQPRDLNGDGVIGTWTWETAWRANNNSQTLANWWATEVNPGGNTGRALIQGLDGRSNEFVRAERANLNWNYRFTDRLKGFRFGGGIRWRPAPLVAYEGTIIGGTDAPDLNKPIYSEDETKIDLSFGYKGKFNFPLLGERDYTISLNIRNVTEPSAIAQLKDVNGNDIRMIRPEPRNFILQFDMDI